MRYHLSNYLILNILEQIYSYYLNSENNFKIFDDVGLIQWDSLQSILEYPISISYPNDYDYIRNLYQKESIKYKCYPIFDKNQFEYIFTSLTFI